MKTKKRGPQKKRNDTPRAGYKRFTIITSCVLIDWLKAHANHEKRFLMDVITDALTNYRNENTEGFGSHNKDL